MAASSSSSPLEAAATRVCDALAVVMSDKCSPAAEAALAAAAADLKLARAKYAAPAAAAAAIEKSTPPITPAAAAAAAALEKSTPPITPAAAAAADLQRMMGKADHVLWLQREKAKKHRRVRLSQETIDYILSYKPQPIHKFRPETYSKWILDLFPVPPDQLMAYFDELDKLVYDGLDDRFLKFQKSVREEYEKKGYAHGWETDDEEDQRQPPPRPARRRPRPGVLKHKGGGTKKLN
ncbi:hypothetical protein BS78_05G027200 [Paspalum vaginatum]|nr:hypothetical protein BS78_05G027200 [Paspalum vaginatum]